MRYAVILAGGSGTRLWPASRRSRPKQFLPFAPNGQSLLGAAVERGRAVAGDNVVIVTAESQREATLEAAPGVEVIAEPMARNTAAALGLAAAILLARDPDAVMIVLPADQRVADEPGLTRVLDAGLAEVERTDAIGTVGIAPTRAETGFGYLEVEADAPLGQVTPVKRFVEKPNQETAAQMFAAKSYLWNAGMFFISARRLVAELETHVPPIGRAVQEIAAGRARAEDEYPTLPSISIDHAVMERATRVFTIPAAVGWDDIGSWAAVADVLGIDDEGNALAGNAVVVGGTGNVILSDDTTIIATAGVSDLVVVKVGDAILVLPKAASQDVRAIVDELAKRGLERFL